MRLAECIALVFATSIYAFAQDAISATPQPDPAAEPSVVAAENLVPQAAPAPTEAAPDVVWSSISTAPAYTPLTLKQKWLYSVSEIFGPSRLAGYAVHTLVDYGFDLPKQWGRSGDSLAVRVAGDFGDSFIRYNIQFAIQALDHEDPRYFRSNLHGGWARTKYALAHTFVVRKDDQSWMPAYSLLVTDYGMPYIVRQWRPERFHALDAVQAGSLGIGISMGSNIFSEFWPDLKRKLSKAPFLRQSWLNYGIR